MVIGVAMIVSLYLTLSTDRPDYLGNKVRDLHSDQAAIQRYVRDQIEIDPYRGVLRGAVGTLWAGAGSNEDRAVLLEALLRRAGNRTRFVLASASELGVEIERNGAFQWAGPGLAPGGYEPVSAVPDDLFHTLSIGLEVGGNALAVPLVVRPSDLAGTDITVAFRDENGSMPVITLNAGTVSATFPLNGLAPGEVVMVLRTDGPGAAPVERRRALNPGLSSISNLTSPSRYRLVVTGGWVGNEVVAGESERVSDWTDQDAARAHTLAYSFLAISDAEARRLLNETQIMGRIASPRITIVGDEPGAGSGRIFSLDLRKDDMAIDGNGAEAKSVALIRALTNASLESAVLSQVTGLPATSAADILAGAIARLPTSVEGRRLQLQSVLRRMNDPKEPDGTTVRVFPQSRPDYKIELRRQADRIVVSLSEPVAHGLDASIREETALLQQPVDANNIDRVAVILDAAIVVSARVPINYALMVEYRAPSPSNIYNGTRLVFTRPWKTKL
jgi:hypothetical protein